MRTLKFRNWNIPTKQMFYFSLYSPVWRSLSADDRNTIPGYNHLMQFTGLKDKNGKEIYEGDIIRFEAEKEFGVIKWLEDAMWGYGLYWKEQGVMGDEHPIAGWVKEREIPFEIIGNIYQNPELLK